MRFIATLLALLTTVQMASATIPAPDLAQFQNKNQLGNYNPGAENGTQFWTASAGTFTTTSTAANVGAGNRAFSWVTTTAGQTLKSKLAPIDAGLYGQIGLAQVMLQTAATDMVLSVTDGTNTLGTLNITGAGASQYSTYQLNFVFPSSGSVQLVLTSGSAETVYVDNAYLGSALNLTNVSQAKLIGRAYIYSSGCSWANNIGTSYGNFSTNASCAAPTVIVNAGPGTISTTVTNLPQFTVNNLSPGLYKVMFNFSGGNDTLTGRTGFRINDGSTTSGEASNQGVAGSSDQSLLGYFNYTTAGSYTYTIQAYNNNGTANIHADSSGIDSPFWFTIEQIPSSTQLAITPNTSPTLFTGYTSLTGGNEWNRSSSSLGIPTISGGTPTLVTRLNINAGTVAQSGTAPAIAWTPPKTGTFYICAKPLVKSTTGDTVTATIYDGTTDITTGAQFATAGTSLTTSMQLCGYEFVTNAGTPIVFSIRIASTGANNAIINDAPGLANAIEWSILDATQNFPNPYIVGQVSSSTSGQERVERVYFGGAGTATSPTSCTSSPCTIYKQSGGISSVSWSSSGIYDINFSPAFSDIPSCTCTTDGPNYGNNTIVTTDGTINTASKFRVRTYTPSGTATPDYATCICMGPR